MVILIILMILVIVYIYVYSKVDSFYLEPIRINKYKFDNVLNKDKFLNIDNEHYAVYEKEIQIEYY